MFRLEVLFLSTPVATIILIFSIQNNNLIHFDTTTNEDCDNQDLIIHRLRYRFAIVDVDMNQHLNFNDTIEEVKRTDTRTHSNLLNSDNVYDATKQIVNIKNLFDNVTGNTNLLNNKYITLCLLRKYSTSEDLISTTIKTNKLVVMDVIIVLTMNDKINYNVRLFGSSVNGNLICVRSSYDGEFVTGNLKHSTNLIGKLSKVIVKIATEIIIVINVNTLNNDLDIYSHPVDMQGKVKKNTAFSISNDYNNHWYVMGDQMLEYINGCKCCLVTILFSRIVSFLLTSGQISANIPNIIINNQFYVAGNNQTVLIQLLINSINAALRFVHNIIFVMKIDIMRKLQNWIAIIMFLNISLRLFKTRNCNNGNLYYTYSSDAWNQDFKQTFKFSITFRDDNININHSVHWIDLQKYFNDLKFNQYYTMNYEMYQHTSVYDEIHKLITRQHILEIVYLLITTHVILVFNPIHNIILDKHNSKISSN